MPYPAFVDIFCCIFVSADTRKDFLHKLSTKVVSENQTIILEDLNVSGMVKNRRLARVISLQGWREFRVFCEAKAEKLNREFRVISRWEPTSQTYSYCGYRWGKIDLSVRWLKSDCYSAVLQCVAINLNKAYANFFEGRAKFPRFKSKNHRQSIQYPQNVTIVENCLNIPKIGEVKAVFHRVIEGKIKTVTIIKTPTDKYYASILVENDGESIQTSGDKTIGIDLGIKDFAIVHDGEQAAKYSNPKHLKRHERNLARKQKKLARKVKGSKSKNKFRKLVAKVHERVSNSHQDFLHKLSIKLVNESQIIVVENLNVKGMVRNRKLSKSISDVGWGMFVNFIDYKLKAKDGQPSGFAVATTGGTPARRCSLVEIGRFFPSSKTCSCCGHIVDELPLDIREWDCPACKNHHDRDANASKNIRAEGIRILSMGGGNPVLARGDVRPISRKVERLLSMKPEAHTYC
ncbi:IS200/IS605 family element transposase accessory protein TnpB [Calothrix sp. FACHB-156]|nr:IS200/IS605 family element transposase accessory protein TnpB [Calothrix sp. FACHB-156]